VRGTSQPCGDLLAYPASRRTGAIGVLLLVLLLALQSGCGFRLRGAVDLPPGLQATYIQSVSPHSELVADLRRALQAAGAEVVAEPRQAEVVLHIRQEEVGRRVLSVDARGRARERELHYTVAYSLRDRTGRDLAEPRTVVLTRDYLFDETAVLGSEQEEAALVRDMQRQVTRQILQHLAAVGA
jgi:LPS-assembly lipoprotein